MDEYNNLLSYSEEPLTQSNRANVNRTTPTITPINGGNIHML